MLNDKWLRIQRKGGRFQYWLCKRGIKTNVVYVPKKNLNSLKPLIQRDYAARVLSAVDSWSTSA